MPWFAAPLCAVALACLIAGATRAILPRLPEPHPDESDAAEKLPYAALATPGFILATALAALAAGLAAFVTQPVQHWLAWSALAGVSVVACAIDARTTWLPRVLSWAGWGVAAAGVLVTAALAGSWTPLLASAVGAAVLLALFHGLWRFTGAFGYGDVRLAATIGAVTALSSATLVGWSLLFGTAAGAVLGIVHHLRGRRGGFAYGPGLLAGPFLASVLLGVSG